MFEIAGEIDAIETIAVGRGIRELRRLKKAYGGTRWRKRKGAGQGSTARWQLRSRRATLVRGSRSRSS